jgi:hypothetical protein
VVVGDSHVDAVQAALRARQAAGIPVSIEARRTLKVKAQGPAPASVGNRIAARLRAWIGSTTSDNCSSVIGDTSFDEMLSLARRLRSDDVLVSLVGGNQHAVFGTIQHPQPFDFALPGEQAPRRRKGVEIIPFRTLWDFFSSGIRDGDGAVIAALRSATQARMIHVLAPPPKHKNMFIESHHDTYFKKEGIGRLGVSSADLRMKFWKLQNLAVEEICAGLGIETLPPPPEALDPNGFLAGTFYAGDATHANIAYGELVLAQLEDRFMNRAVAA